MLQDDAFLVQLKQRAPAAYVVLVEQFEGSLYRFFYCQHRDHHLAQDQTAETFMQLVRSLPAMRGSCDQLKAYVFATARHVQLRRFRERKQPATPLSDGLDVAGAQPSPATVAAEREQLERVLDAISRLEDPLPSVLLLRFVEGCSLEEVAQALDLPVGTVKSHIHRSRTRLKQIFAERECET
jgi:RNA polymerase sigma-70 factor (ECF subfamily)